MPAPDRQAREQSQGDTILQHDITYRPLGATCIALGLLAIWIASDYPYGTVTAMGPGFIPTAVAAILVLFGSLILLARGKDLSEQIEGGGLELAPAEPFGFLRAMLSIGAAIVLFGLVVKPLGLGLTVFLTVVVASLGHPGLRLPQALLLALALAVASCLIFVVLLSQSIPMFPRVD